MINDIAFVGYPVTDIKKARAFYEGILGLVPNDDFPAKEDSVFIEYNVGSSTLAIGSTPEWKPSTEGPSVAFEVEDFDAMIQRLKDNNVQFKVEPQTFPTCKMAVIHDPDGNLVTIHKRNK